jgi:hypothetical protein
MSELAVPIQCTLCERKFYGPSAALVGETNAHGAQRLIQQLAKHIAEVHEQHFVAAQMQAAEFQGWKILSLYSTADPKVYQQWDFYRWRIHQASLRCRAVQLDVRARELAKDILTTMATERRKQPDASYEDIATAKILTVLEELRTITEEPDLYKPGDAAKASQDEDWIAAP